MKKSPTWIYLVLALGLVVAAICALYAISQTEPIQVIGQARSPVLSADTLVAGPSAYLLTELQQYRSFIEVERREYQQFLTRVYATIGVLIAALVGGLTFLGIKTLEDLKRKSGEKIEAVQAEIQAKTEAQMAAKLSELMEQKLGEKEHLVTALQQLASRQATWMGAKLRIIAQGESLPRIREYEAAYFQKAGAAVGEPGPWLPSEQPEDYQALMYAYPPEVANGSDAFLVETLLPALRGKRVPLIVYNFYHPGSFIAKSDKTALDQYPFGVLANSPFTLIANTYDAVTLNLSQFPANP